MPSILDLVMTNEEGMIENIEYLSPLGKSDHIIISFDFKCYTQQSGKDKIVYYYGKGNYDKMKTELGGINWQSELDKEAYDINKQWTYNKEKIQEAVKHHIPLGKVNTNQIKKKQQLDKELRTIIRKKQRVWQRYRESNYLDENILTEYHRLRNKVRRATRHYQKCKEKEVADNAKTNPEKLWQYINRKTKTTTGIADLEGPGNKLINDDKEKVEILANFFSSVFTKENMDNKPTICESRIEDDLTDYEVKVEEVRKKLVALNLNKSPGPDNIHPCVLKEMSEVLDKPLAILYQNSIKMEKIPNDWKHAKVTVIFKKGERKKPNNYRPVSLTCIACKVMESIVRDQIMRHMRDDKLFTMKQYGFLDGRSTVLQLLVVLDTWTKIIDEGRTIDCVYCDFTKAFDKVPHT